MPLQLMTFEDGGLPGAIGLEFVSRSNPGERKLSLRESLPAELGKVDGSTQMLY